METIVAISTSTTNAGIGIVRMSGENCFDILNKIFIPKNNEPIKGYKMKYGHIIKSETKELIDEVIVSYFIKPKSYTTENMCEINSHGGFLVEKDILQECLKNGARLAEPGEFTKRAFLNGRIDLTQAEAVMDLINAKSENERKASVKQLEGRLYNKIKDIQHKILDVMADIEASIDYPEYDIEETTNNKIKNILDDVKKDIQKLSNSYENGKIIKEGIKTAIIGKPNVGKSSLLNLMLNEDRAIVSNIEGTTRDTIEEYINLQGITLKIIDTAGIRKTSDEIEKIGVKKTMNIIEHSDLIIAIFDDSRELDSEDKKILELIKNKKAIILINKVDLNKNSLLNNKELLNNNNIVKISTKTEEGINDLYNQIIKMFENTEIKPESSEIITNLRQKQHLAESIKLIEKSYQAINENMPIDITSIYIREILEELGNITGETVSEDIINEIFSKFCLGK